MTTEQPEQPITEEDEAAEQAEHAALVESEGDVDSGENDDGS